MGFWRPGRDLGAQGFRALAHRDVQGENAVTKADEVAMTFLGFLVLVDPPKPKVAETVAELGGLGILAALVSLYSPIAGYLGFEPLSAPLVAMIVAIVAIYVATAELAKRLFYRRWQ